MLSPAPATHDYLRALVETHQQFFLFYSETSTAVVDDEQNHKQIARSPRGITIVATAHTRDFLQRWHFTPAAGKVCFYAHAKKNKITRRPSLDTTEPVIGQTKKTHARTGPPTHLEDLDPRTPLAVLPAAPLRHLGLQQGDLPLLPRNLLPQLRAICCTWVTTTRYSIIDTQGCRHGVNV